MNSSVLALDEPPDRTEHKQCSVQNGVKADEWLRAALSACGGRGGGRATSAQGQAPQSGEMRKGMAAAEEFIGGR